MQSPRQIELDGEARLALGQILAIMTDHAMSGGAARWDLERVLELEHRLDVPSEVATDAELASVRTVTIGIDDAALLLDGMAFTEVASAELPWVEMVRWTSDFITAELRQHWTDDEWRALAGS
ncbi:MAG: hypothetical protein HRT86_04860 [Ilumatobacteraceae bacterium]|nr:hypothetical protein [Ilumatobacteraceae bacterium]